MTCRSGDPVMFCGLIVTPWALVPSMRKLPSPPTSCSGTPLMNCEIPENCQLPRIALVTPLFTSGSSQL